MKMSGPIKIGDVFKYNGGYGKERPWLVLSVRKNGVVAVCMSTSEHQFCLLSVESRFWPESKICKTISVFSHDTVKENMSFPYDNRKHIQEIKKNLRKIMQI